MYLLGKGAAGSALLGLRGKAIALEVLVPRTELSGSGLGILGKMNHFSLCFCVEVKPSLIRTSIFPGLLFGLEGGGQHALKQSQGRDDALGGIQSPILWVLEPAERLGSCFNSVTFSKTAPPPLSLLSQQAHI